MTNNPEQRDIEYPGSNIFPERPIRAGFIAAAYFVYGVSTSIIDVGREAYSGLKKRLNGPKR